MSPLDNASPETFWLGWAAEDISKPQTEMFEVHWLSTNKPGHPGFQKVGMHCSKIVFPMFSQIYVDSGVKNWNRASCILMTGVRLSRMTEPEDADEWWELSTSMKARLKAVAMPGKVPHSIFPSIWFNSNDHTENRSTPQLKRYLGETCPFQPTQTPYPR